MHQQPAEVPILAGMLLIGHEVRSRVPDFRVANGLVQVIEPGCACMVTPHQTGNAYLGVDVYDTPPGLVDESWEDVVEFSMQSRRNCTPQLNNLGEDLMGFPPIPTDEDGWTNFRLSARDRDSNKAGQGTYWLQCWTGTPIEARDIRLTSPFGKSYRYSLRLSS